MLDEFAWRSQRWRDYRLAISHGFQEHDSESLAFRSGFVEHGSSGHDENVTFTITGLEQFGRERTGKSHGIRQTHFSRNVFQPRPVVPITSNHVQRVWKFRQYAWHRTKHDVISFIPLATRE